MSNSPSDHDIREFIRLLDAGRNARALSAGKKLADKYPSAPISHLILGAALAKEGKLDPAIHSYRKALKLKPDYFEAWHNMAEALRRGGRLQDALNSYSSALKLQPENAYVKDMIGKISHQLGNEIAARGEFEAAAELFRNVVAFLPDSPAGREMLGLSLFHSGRRDEALACLEDAVTAQPHRIQSLAHLAIVSKALGRPDRHFLQRILDIPAETFKDRATKMWAALVSGEPALAFSLPLGKEMNVMPWEIAERLPALAGDLQMRLRALPEMLGSHPANQTTRPVIYAGGDGVYAQKFAEDLVASALSQCPGCDFHLHVMNPGSYDAARTLSQFPVGRVTWSSEDLGPGGKVLYSQRRFVRMAQLCAEVERPIILVDMDIVFNGDIVRALPERYDVVIYDRPEDPWIHQMVNAGFLAISPGGRAFVTFLANYILHFEAEGTSKWFDDQLGIACARAWFEANRPTMLIKAAPKNTMDWTGTHQSDSLIWHAKGHLKDADSASVI